jgi:hypothetical protein
MSHCRALMVTFLRRIAALEAAFRISLGEYVPENIHNRILQFANLMSEVKSDNPHLNAVRAQVSYAGEIYRGIIEVSSEGNGLAGEALTRTVFEVVTSTIILAKHGEKFQEFIRHGRFTELRMLRVIETASLKARLAAVVAATEAEYRQLFDEFKEQRWHKLGTRDSFKEAEFQPDMYDRYYRRASAVAHGQPYVTVRHGTVQARPIAWKNLSTGALNTASLLMIFLLMIVSREFKLGLEKEIDELNREVHDAAFKHMDAIRNHVGLKDN